MQIGGAISRSTMTRGAAKRPTGGLKAKASAKLSTPTGKQTPVPSSKSGGSPVSSGARGNPGSGY